MINVDVAIVVRKVGTSISDPCSEFYTSSDAAAIYIDSRSRADARVGIYSGAAAATYCRCWWFQHDPASLSPHFVPKVVVLKGGFATKKQPLLRPRGLVLCSQ
jgi:hypothetical protein